MKKLTMVICLMFALSPFAFAQNSGGTSTAAPAAAETPKKEPSEKQKAQRAKMKACNKDAKEKGLKGKDRKQFMSDCLKG